MKNNVKIQDDTQSLQSCVSVSVTDLRIGNLVMVDNEKYHPKLKDVVLEITEVNESMGLDFKNSHGIGLKHINQKPYTYYERYSQLITFIKPIPLTESLLLKIGAIKLDFKDFPSFNLFGTQINFVNGLWIEYVSRVEIKGLHHLQNIFFFRNSEELQIGNLTEH